MRMLHYLRVDSRITITQSHTHTMQQTHTQKEVTGRVEAKKLLSRRRQSEYRLVAPFSLTLLVVYKCVLAVHKSVSPHFQGYLHHIPLQFCFWQYIWVFLPIPQVHCTMFPYSFGCCGFGVGSLSFRSSHAFSTCIDKDIINNKINSKSNIINNYKLMDI